jgi:outer membrane protein assembly factor BamA
MQRTRFLTALLAYLAFTTLLHASCASDQNKQSTKTQLLITDFTVNGTQAIDSAELAKITNQLTGECVDDNTSEIEERIEALFKDRGFADVVVKNLRIKPNDPLALPKPVSLEAEVIEGPKFTVGEINFVGNHVFDTPKLRSEFPLEKGDVFARGKIASGILGVVHLYLSNGYLDWIASSDAQKLSAGTFVVTLSIIEGPQYRMGKLDIFAKKEAAEKLRAAWELPEGAVFDSEYLAKYVDTNRAPLPPESCGRTCRSCATARIRQLKSGCRSTELSPDLNPEPKTLSA